MRLSLANRVRLFVVPKQLHKVAAKGIAISEEGKERLGMRGSSLAFFTHTGMFGGVNYIGLSVPLAIFENPGDVFE